MKTARMALFGLALCLNGRCEAATVIISQNNFTGLADYTSGFGQSFTLDKNESIVGINLYVSSSFGGSDITIQIFKLNDAGTALAGKTLGTGFLAEEGITSTVGWRTIPFTTPVAVAASKAKYAFIVYATDPGGTATGWNNYGFSSVDSYAGGTSQSISGGAVVTRSSDLTFQIVAVPEPGGMGIACVTMAFATHRRKRR